MWIAFVVVLAGGCVLREDLVHVTLRDPARVEVYARSGAPILDGDASRGEIPASEPTYLHDPVPGSWVDRTTEGAVEAWCPGCRSWKHRTVVESAELALPGTVAEVVRFDAGMLHVRYLFNDGVRGHRGRLFDVPRLQLDLVTPVANVVAIDYEAHVSDRNGGPPDVRRGCAIAGLVFGTVFALGGGALGGVGFETHDRVVEVTGGVMIAIGAAVVAGMWHMLSASDEHTLIALPR